MSEENKNQKNEEKRKYAGLFIPAGIFIGMGVGWAIGNFLPGLFIGMGAGFLCFALVMIFARD